MKKKTICFCVFFLLLCLSFFAIKPFYAEMLADSLPAAHVSTTKINVLIDNALLYEGKLYSGGEADTVVIGLTGLHGNLSNNLFYELFGQSLARIGIDFIYAPLRDSQNKFEVPNVKTGQMEQIGSFNSSLSQSNKDVAGYLNYAWQRGYKQVILAGHSLGANKIIKYLAENPQAKVDYFILISPADLSYLTQKVSEDERSIIKSYVQSGKGSEVLPFKLFGWVECTADIAYEWLFNNPLDNVHFDENGNFEQIEKVQHLGALLIGAKDGFAFYDSQKYLTTINSHFKNAARNKMVIVQDARHAFENKEREVANAFLDLVQSFLTSKR